MAFLYDGYSTQVAFYDEASNLQAVYLRIKTVTPPEMDGGGALDSSDMGNRRIRTQAPKSLLTVGQLKCSAYYDPFIFTQYLIPPQAGYFQRNLKVIMKFPDNSGLLFFGWIDKVSPPEHKEGDEPIADVMIIPSCRGNLDTRGKADGFEVPPQYLTPGANGTMLQYLIANNFLPQL